MSIGLAIFNTWLILVVAYFVRDVKIERDDKPIDESTKGGEQ